ncbi:uncharacterized protein LOC142344125 isoform X1 [Convolutriloba macropyga]|uniref:uncharacterized protein LOC142344125 isoform X1 n=2 Tax=Convolutriloba macropyga TaxID=536237 RepID=UPI003F520A8E
MNLSKCCYALPLYFTLLLLLLSFAGKENHYVMSFIRNLLYNYQEQKIFGFRITLTSKGKTLPFCQSSTKYITFSDVSSCGYGLLHKFDDFICSAQLAILLNRTLIDYSPRWSGNHAGTEFRKSKFYHGWQFLQLFEPSKFTFSLRSPMGEEKQCRLRVVNKYDAGLALPSIVSVEYDRKGKCSECHYRTCDVRPHNSKVTLLDDFNQNEINPTNEKKEFSMFIKITAAMIRTELLKIAMTSRISETESANQGLKSPQFVVLHLRASDRPCVLKQLTPNRLIQLLTNFGVNNNTVLYVMTNAPENSTHMAAIKKELQALSVFTASDVAIFQDPVFLRMGRFLIYAMELQLQSIADGLILTYPGHRLPNKHNEWGVLATEQCIKALSNKTLVNLF